MMLGQPLPLGAAGYLPGAPIQATTAHHLASNQFDLAAAANAAAMAASANGSALNSAAISAAAAVDRNSPEYLAQLLNDKKILLQLFPNVFQHVEKILEEEINRVRGSLFHLSTNKEPLQLPEETGSVVTLSEKLPVPVKEYPDFNFVGRILGPRGQTAKLLEQDTGCRIMVRGKGSMRDKSKEDQNRGKPNWEHLNEDLHVLITVEDTENRAEIKLRRAMEEVKKLLVPAPDGEDELKKRQLMELAIINGTYRDTTQQGCNTAAAAAAGTSLLALSIPAGAASCPSGGASGSLANRMLTASAAGLPIAAGAMQHFVRPAAAGVAGSPAVPAGTPIFLAAAPRIQLSPAAQYSSSVPSTAQLAAGGAAGLTHASAAIAVSGAAGNGFVYPIDQLMRVQPMFDYSQSYDASPAGAIQKMRRAPIAREHPYNR